MWIYCQKKICGQFTLLVHQVGGEGMWLRVGIVILARLEYNFIRVQEDVVQHTTTMDCFLLRYCKLPYNANLVHLQRKV